MLTAASPLASNPIAAAGAEITLAALLAQGQTLVATLQGGAGADSLYPSDVMAVEIRVEQTLVEMATLRQIYISVS